jgi:hypothetical protein
VPFDAIVMPGGSPEAVKVRVCDVGRVLRAVHQRQGGQDRDGQDRTAPSAPPWSGAPRPSQSRDVK